MFFDIHRHLYASGAKIFGQDRKSDYACSTSAENSPYLHPILYLICSIHFGANHLSFTAMSSRHWGQATFVPRVP